MSERKRRPEWMFLYNCRPEGGKSELFFSFCSTKLAIFIVFVSIWFSVCFSGWNKSPFWQNKSAFCSNKTASYFAKRAFGFWAGLYLWIFDQKGLNWFACLCFKIAVQGNCSCKINSWKSAFWNLVLKIVADWLAIFRLKSVYSQSDFIKRDRRWVI